MTKWDGLLPISGPGSDLGTVSRKAGPKACVRGRKPGAWPSVRERHGQGSAVSRHTFWCHDLVWQNWCRDTLLGVATWMAFMVSRRIVSVATRKRQDELKWCRDTVFDVATRFGLLVLRPTVWCHDLVWSPWGRDLRSVSQPAWTGTACCVSRHGHW